METDRTAGGDGDEGGLQCPGCGLLFTNCSKARGAWTLQSVGGGNNPSISLLQWNLTSTVMGNRTSTTLEEESVVVGSATPPAKPKCLAAHLSSGVGGFYGGPKAALTTLKSCPGGGGAVSNTSTRPPD